MDKKISKLAVVALIIAIISIILQSPGFSLAAIIIGFVALVKIKKNSAKGKGVAIASIGLGIITLITSVYFAFNFGSYSIPTRSMAPTIKPGDKIFVYKKAYDTKKPERGDIVVFHPPPNESKKPFVFRIIGLPGEELAIKKETIYINEKKVAHPDIAQFYYYNQGEYVKENKEVIIPQGRYFVLGDNSIAANDSRFWGFVDEENIVGKVKYRWFPFGRIKKFE